MWLILSQGIRLFLMFLAAVSIFLSASCKAQTTNYDEDVAPGFQPKNEMASNWLVEARAVIPAKYFAKGDLKFEQITNLLCEQSRDGNNAASGLWGMVLLLQSHSQDQSQPGLQLLKESAQNGYVPAMLNLGFLYENGTYVPQDYVQAFHCFFLAASAGSAEGELQLGACYFYGFGTARDFTMALKYNRLAAEHTNYVAMKSLGYMLSNGLGTGKDLDAAKYWSTRAAREGGNRRAMYNLGVIYQLKFPDTNAMAQAFYWYQRSAQLGDAMACSSLAGCYRNGWGCETNTDSYLIWLYKAATLGATAAEYEMGATYSNGKLVPRDTEASIMWFRRAAVKNHPLAVYNLAVWYLADKTNPAALELANDCMYRAALGGNREAQFQCALSRFRSETIPHSSETGEQWLVEAANNGWGKAEYMLFELYYNGLSPGTNYDRYPQDKIEGIKWLRRAAGHGDFHAESVLAVMLIQGTEITRDPMQAEKMLRDAAKHGYPVAQNDLGFALLSSDIGNASAADFVEAAMWFQLAKSHATDANTMRRASVNLSNALARLTPEEQFEAEQRAKNFQSLPVVQNDPLVKGWDKNPAYQQEDGHHW